MEKLEGQEWHDIPETYGADVVQSAPFGAFAFVNAGNTNGAKIMSMREDKEREKGVDDLYAPDFGP